MHSQILFCINHVMIPRLGWQQPPAEKKQCGLTLEACPCSTLRSTTNLPVGCGGHQRALLKSSICSFALFAAKTANNNNFSPPRRRREVAFDMRVRVCVHILQHDEGINQILTCLLETIF